MADAGARAACVVVTYDALPWIERCLASVAELAQTVKFFTAPKTMGDWRRLDFAWFLLHDEIHHRGQLSVYVRAAGGKVPSIYGPSGDEPWT